jgi:hypothetical protein
MPEDNTGQKRPAHAESDLKKMQQRLVDETSDESFPASDPPAWTTTGTKSVAGQADRSKSPVREGSQPEEGLAGQATRLAERVYETGRHYLEEAQERLPEAQRYLDQGRQYVKDAQERYPQAQRYLEQGQHYVDRGRQAVAAPVTSYPLTAVALAGAVGFGLAWWLYGGSRSSSREMPAYGKRQRQGWRPGHPMTPAERHRAEAHLAANSRAAGMASAAPDSF